MSHDNEVSEMWSAYKKVKQDASTQRRENAPVLLEGACVPFTVHNNGAHLILDTHLGFVDFWPGTTKWKVRDSGKAGYGLTKLLQLIKPVFPA